MGVALVLSLAAGTPGAAQDTHALIVSGLGGTAEYRERFTGWATSLHESLTGRMGLPSDRVSVLAERAEAAPGVAQGRSTRDNVLAALGEAAAASAPGDRVLVVLIGHGTAQGEQGRFNLPGPDLSSDDLAAALAAFADRTVAVVHTGSASGGFLAPLSGPGRIIVTATRTVRERNATEFPRYFVEALAGDGADLDKDGAVSVLEAFLFARQEVQRHYEEANELLTEHAMLDDNGDGEGSADAGPDAADGALAATFVLGGGVIAAEEQTDDPVLARLYEERRVIQERIDGLRASRDALPPERYQEQLEALLVELALKNREIRAREGGGA